MKSLPSATGRSNNLLLPTLASLCLAPMLQASVIFQADFNGSGTGTGGANDIVTLGGTGSLFNYTTATTSIVSSPAMGQGNFLQVNSGANPAAGYLGGANLTPASAANSFAAMNTISGGKVTLHGASDFFFRAESVSDLNVGNWFRPLDQGSPTTGGMSLRFHNLNGTTLRLHLQGDTGAFLTGGSYTNPAANIYLDVPLTFTLNTIYHIGYTLSTDLLTDVSTIKIFARTDAGVIDTTSNTNLLGSYSFKIDGTVVTTGLPSGAFAFNLGGFNSGSPKVVDGDLFRLYDAVPASFSAIPEPQTLAAVLLAGSALFVGIRRRR